MCRLYHSRAALEVTVYHAINPVSCVTRGSLLTSTSRSPPPRPCKTLRQSVLCRRVDVRLWPFETWGKKKKKEKETRTKEVWVSAGERTPSWRCPEACWIYRPSWGGCESQAGDRPFRLAGMQSQIRGLFGSASTVAHQESRAVPAASGLPYIRVAGMFFRGCIELVPSADNAALTAATALVSWMAQFAASEMWVNVRPPACGARPPMWDGILGELRKLRNRFQSS